MVGMTQMNSWQRLGVLPLGEEIATFEKYEAAQAAVDALADAEFPVRKVSIIGTDLRMVERVTGRMNFGRAALSGALSGMWFGLMIGLLWVIVGAADFSPVVLGVTLGGVFGALFGLAAHALSGGKRDFTSISQVVATRYGLRCETDVAFRCRQILQERGIIAPAARPPVVDLTEPPRYGERITPPETGPTASDGQ